MSLLLAALSRHARHAPDRIALSVAGNGLSYRELDRRVDRTATVLRHRGAGPGQRIGVMGHKSADAVVSVLAVLRTGATYVPLDPGAPPGRVAELLADARCPLVLVAPTDRAVVDGLSGAPTTALDPHRAESSDVGLPECVDADGVAYCMYTSGSTGRPKGVQITHRAMDSFFTAVHPLLGVEAGDRCLNTSALVFDVSMVDLFYPLVRGATVFLSPLIPLPPLLVGLIERERITHLAAVGSTLALVAETTDGFRGRDITSLRRLMTGAEVLDPAAVQRWLAAAPELTVVNGYGPTEATCLVVAQPISEREPGRTEPYPIGLPLDGVTVRFLRDDGAVDADGPGELLVAGEQVMLGYLDRPHEQQRAYLRVGSVAFYRTGDRGHRGADGTLFYHGRGDDEVKVRGYRVNLLEVRHALESHDAVGRAFVAVSTDRRGRHILACAVASPGTPRSEVPSGAPLPALDVERTRSLRAHLTQRLPGYMVPADYRLLPEIPMLSSGKPDTAGIRLRLIAAAEERG